MDSALLSFLSQNVTTFVVGPNVSFRRAPNVLRTFFLILRFNNPTCVCSYAFVAAYTYVWVPLHIQIYARMLATQIESELGIT